MIEMRINSHEDLARFREELISKASQSQLAVSVCMSTGCVALGSHELLDALKKEITDQNLGDKVVIKETGCLGFCEKGPRVTI
jgi:NADH:ubiquinone oxidoreductase subunit E